jgi:Protein of unknown function (DUF732)
MKKTIIAAIAALMFTAVIPVGVAHADDQSYIADLKAHGAPVLPGLEGNWIGDGHRMCNEMRAGVSRANVAAEVTQTDPVMFMDVLQHQLCPDTMR